MTLSIPVQSYYLNDIVAKYYLFVKKHQCIIILIVNHSITFSKILVPSTITIPSLSTNSIYPRNRGQGKKLMKKLWKRSTRLKWNRLFSGSSLRNWSRRLIITFCVAFRKSWQSWTMRTWLLGENLIRLISKRSRIKAKECLTVHRLKFVHHLIALLVMKIEELILKLIEIMPVQTWSSRKKKSSWLKVQHYWAEVKWLHRSTINEEKAS